MRWICAPLIVILAGCGTSEAELNKARKEGEEIAAANQLANQLAAQNTIQARAECEANQRRQDEAHATAIADAERDIRAELGGVVTSGNPVPGLAGGWRFDADIETLAPNEWRWAEEETDHIQLFGSLAERSQSSRFTVNPGRLVAQVETALYLNRVPAIVLRCAADARCIHKEGRIVERTPDGRETVRTVSRLISSNFWPVGDSDRAEAVAGMLTRLIGLLRNPPQATDCSAAG